MKVADISGMGGRENGGYEWGCQVICARALRFLQQNPAGSALPQYEQYENIVGVAIAANDKAKEMDKFISSHKKLQEFGMTGAMHQYGIAHAKAIHRLGRQEYERQLREAGRTDEDFYDFNESDAFPEDK